MLQQTQAPRVVPKYESFLEKFPTTAVLAAAELKDVLSEWQGLGYNRRAIYLKRTAVIIEREFAGKFPKDFATLCALPGIGPATAGDMMAFAWNVPATVIETNIRSVFIHFFFPEKEGGTRKSGAKKISDKEILPLIEKTLDRENPREWYSALFDYGAHLKETSNPSRRSAHHVKQSAFVGSYRQKRAAVLKQILKRKLSTKNQLQKILKYESGTIEKILTDLEKDGFIRKTDATKGTRKKLLYLSS